MADNTVLPVGAGGDTIRGIDRLGVKTQVVTLDLGGAGAETLVAGTVPVSGTLTANIGTVGALATEATLATVAKEGVAITGQALEAGGSSVLGWLSSIRKAITDRLPAALVGGRLDVNIGAGTVTANAGTNLNTSALALDATLTGGTAKAIARGGAKGTTVAADVTSTAQGANNQALDVQLYHGGAAINPQTIRALTNADIVKAQLQDNAGAAITLAQKLMASSVPVVLASDQTVIPVNGDVDHDAVNTLKNIQMGGHASPVDLPPTAVSASGDRVRAWFDRNGANVVRRRKIRESYTAVARLAEAAARLDQTFTQVANTNKQWSTLHHAAVATKEIRLQRCWAYITSDTVAGIQGVIELRELSSVTAPATGNPAITGRPHRIGTGAHEATCLYLPTTQGSEAAANSPLGHVPFDTGISGAVSTLNPVPILTPIVLYDAAQEDDEVLPPTAPVGVYGGWAVVVRTVGAPVLRITIVWKFTEEIP